MLSFISSYVNQHFVSTYFTLGLEKNTVNKTNTVSCFVLICAAYRNLGPENTAVIPGEQTPL